MIRPHILNRRIHYWISIAVAAPLLVVVVSGLLLQLKKQLTWVQPREHRGTSGTPRIGLDGILSAVRADPSLAVRDWDDIDRIDVRPGRGIAKVLLATGWEAQIDLATGRLLQKAYRRSDLIESLHDGSFFAGDWTKLGLFLPSGVALFALLLTGLWMFWHPIAARRKKAKAAASPRAGAPPQQPS